METLGVGLENKSQEVGSQGTGEEEEVQIEILDHQEEYSFPEELHEGGCQEFVTSGHGASKNLGSTCSGFGPNRKIEIEEADGSSSGQKGHSLAVLVQGSRWPRSRGITLHLGHSVQGKRSLDWKMTS